MNARTMGTMLYLLAGAFGLAAGGTTDNFSRFEGTPAPILDFFYVIHVHAPDDYQVPTQAVFNEIVATVRSMADTLESHGARGTFEWVPANIDAARIYHGIGNNILTELQARGHEVGAHAHNTDLFQRSRDALVSASVADVVTMGGRAVIPGNASTFADTVQLTAGTGFRVLTDNWSPTDTFGGASWCSDFGLGGNTMYNQTNNIMHPWRPDYPNRDICAHNPAAGVVYVDHAIPDWLQASPPPLSDTNFNTLKPWFEASLQNLHPEQVNAWGFVSHQVEYNPPLSWSPDPGAIAALDRFLTYVDGFIVQGNVRYSRARDIADRFVQWESTPPTEQPVYVLINNHVEGDFGMQPGDPACMALVYQTASLPPPGQPNPGPSFALDIVGTEIIRNVLDAYTDAVSQTPKVFICPAGEFWQTEADPVYGGRLFDTHNYLARGDEFGIQGHGIYYSGQSFCWYNSAHTPEGIQQKLSDLHFFAQQVMYQGQPVNHGLTLTGGSKLEAPALGTAAAEWSIDHAAFDLGYRISYEDHDGHVEDEPAGINNARAGYYLYRADYGDGVRMWKIDMNGSVTATCGGGTARCETPGEAIARLDATLAARAADPDPRQIYYAAFVIHAGGVWDDYHRAAGGAPMVGEGLGLVTLMDALQSRVAAGANLRFVTPTELVGLHVALGDFDADGDVDLADFAQFEICFTGPGGTLAPGCEPGDFDDDNDINCDDWAQFVLAWTEPGQPPQLSQCSTAPIPTVSQWGLVDLILLLVTAGTIVLRRTSRAQVSRVALTSCAVLIALMIAPAPTRAAQSPAAGDFVPAADAVADQEGHVTSVELPASSGLVTFTPGQNPVLVEQSEVPKLPIHVVYVNHVEVESVIDYVPPLVEGRVYTATPARYAFTSGQVDWEISQAEAAGTRISFHMSGAYAERAASAGHQTLWGQRLVAGHTVGVHFHSFLRGVNPFEWVSRQSPTQTQIVQTWQINHDLVANLVGAAALWIGESHYGCQSCWQSLGYRLASTEQMALLPAGQHIVWLVERNLPGVITYPHFPQTGQAGWHGPLENQIYFDLRVPQLKKEFLMLYLEWLERERLNLPAQAWCFGWLNHGGQNTVVHAADIAEMFAWAGTEFVGRTSLRGNLIARFVNDHEVSDIYEDYETWGQPLPSPLSNVNDQFPYMAYALEDAGLVADLTNDLGSAGIRLFELERNPPEDSPSGPPPRVYLLFRETDGTGPVDIGAVLTSRGVDAANLTLIDVVIGSTSQVNGSSLLLGPTPLVLEASYATAPVPTVSPWGLGTLTLLLMTAGTIVIRRTRRARAWRLTHTCCAVLIALMTAPAPARAAQNSAAGGFVLVTERAGTTVSKIDVDTDQIIGRATVGDQPSDLAADRVRRWVYVAANLDHKIVAMKADTLETADLNIPGLGKLPIGVEITPDGGTLLVTTRGSDGIISADDRLDVIRLNASSWPPTGSLIASISTGLHPIGACLGRDGRHAVITVRNQPAILIVDLQTNQIVGQAQNLPLDAEPEGCDVHPTANVVYVTLHGPVSTVEVFDLDTLTHVTHVPIVHTPPARPSTGVFTPDGGRFYVSGQTVNKVFLFETSDPLNPVQNMAVQLPVGQQPHFIVYLPGDRAYVANTNNEQPYGSLAIIHEYSAIPTVSGPILTTLAGPLRFVQFSSPGSGDFDSDGDVDADDAARFETCFTGANGGPIDPGCEPGDFDGDNDIDCTDWARFVLVWTAPGAPPELATCVAPIPALSGAGLVALAVLLLAVGSVVIRRSRPFMA